MKKIAAKKISSALFLKVVVVAALFGLLPISALARSRTFFSHFSFFASRVIERQVASKKYIVVLKDGAAAKDARDVAEAHQIMPTHVYRSALSGFSAELNEETLNSLKNDPQVDFISEDREVQISGFGDASSVSANYNSGEYPTGIRRVNAPHPTFKGEGIAVAVIDTGIDLTHPDLRENIIAHTNCVGFSASGDDDHGHGSHVAGTIAGRENGSGVLGVAPHAKLVAVKVLNAWGSGTWSSVVCGIDWVTEHAAQYNIKVANMSLGGGGVSDDNCGNTNSDALHKAICRSAQAGVTYVVAAGNWGANATSSVPAAYDDTLITVSALADSDGLPFGMGTSTTYGADDTFASFSNYGDVVDIGAPGVDIYSAYKDGNYTKMSGTSMASPHVAGAAAAYIQANPGADWQEVRDGLRAFAYTFYSGHTDPLHRHSEPILRVDAIKPYSPSSAGSNTYTGDARDNRERSGAVSGEAYVSKNLLNFQNRLKRAKLDVALPR